MTNTACVYKCKTDAKSPVGCTYNRRDGLGVLHELDATEKLDTRALTDVDARKICLVHDNERLVVDVFLAQDGCNPSRPKH